MTSPVRGIGNRRTQNRPRASANTGQATASVVTYLKTLSETCTDVKAVMYSINECQKEIIQNQLKCVSFQKEEFQKVVRAVESLKNEMMAINSNQNPPESDVNSEQKHLGKMRAMSCIAYMKIVVSAALLGKGSVWDFYACSEYEGALVDEACRFVYGDNFSDKVVEEFLELQTTADRRGITDIIQPGSMQYVACKKTMRSIRYRMVVVRRRVHDLVVPSVVNAWMRNAPGFHCYRAGSSINAQPQEVKEAAKRLCRIQSGGERCMYLTDPRLSGAFIEACAELCRSAAAHMENGIRDLRKLLGSERCTDLEHEFSQIDINWGRRCHQIYEFDNSNHFTSEQLAFVVVKVSFMNISNSFLLSFRLTHFLDWFKAAGFGKIVRRKLKTRSRNGPLSSLASSCS